MRKYIESSIIALILMSMIGCSSEKLSVDEISLGDIHEQSSFLEQNPSTDIEVTEETKEDITVSEEVETIQDDEDGHKHTEQAAQDELIHQDSERQNENTEEVPEILDFVDVFKEHYQVEINPEIKKHDYNMDSFVHEGDMLLYENDDHYDYKIGIDVSYHNGAINWQKVKESGVDFVIIRAAYRGYGKGGKLNKDKCFEEYITGAHSAGLDVGVYIFSQAISEEEAKEEAEFILRIIKDHEIELPVVYDPESILDAVARTDDVSGDQFTRNTKLFCSMIKDAGYQPMIYSNMLWEAFEFDLTELAEYPIGMLTMNCYHRHLIILNIGNTRMKEI